MGTIKDLVDLVNQLSSSEQDRKFAAELRQIQSMIGAIQSEHAAIHEQRIELMTQNADKRRIEADDSVLAAADSGVAVSGGQQRHQSWRRIYENSYVSGSGQALPNSTNCAWHHHRPRKG